MFHEFSEKLVRIRLNVEQKYREKALHIFEKNVIQANVEYIV